MYRSPEEIQQDSREELVQAIAYALLLAIKEEVRK